MYDVYLKFYNEYAQQYGPNTLIFLMVGKFYELYDTIDAATGEGRTSMRRATELLNIHVSRRPRDGPKQEDGLFAGVPVESLHKYAQVLTREGWTVVVIDQVKDGAGGVIDRKPSRILSPGTHLETATELGCAVAAIWLEAAQDSQSPPRYAISVFETTTGETTSAEGIATGRADDWCCDELLHILQITAPREVLLLWRSASGMQPRPDEALLRSRLGLRSTVLHLRTATPEQQGAFESAHNREEYLAAATHIPSMLPIRTLLQLQSSQTAAETRMERSLCCVIRYIEDHFPSAKQQITRHSIYQNNDTVYLGNNILEQIHFLKSSAHANQQRTVLSLFDRAALTPMGRRSLRARLLNPSSNSHRISQQLEEVSFFHRALSYASNKSAKSPPVEKQIVQETQKLLRASYDIQRLHHSIALGTLDAQQVLQLEQSYEMLQALAALHSDTPFAQPPALQEAIRAYIAAFNQRFSAKKAALQLKGDLLSPLTDEAAPHVAALEAQAAAHLSQWRAKLQSFLFWAQLTQEALRMEKKDEEWIVRGTRTTLAAVQKRCETVKDSPLTQVQIHLKKSVVNTLDCAELEALNATLLSIGAKHAAATRAACAEVCIPLWEMLLTIQEQWIQWISRIDESLALAVVALEQGFSRPTIVDGPGGEGGFAFEDLFHPLLLSAQSRIEYVKHSISLGSVGSEGDKGAKGMLLYGVNASGKSSLMKSIGIAVLLAQAGSFVPARTAVLSPFTSLYSRIWSLDNLWAGLSSFAVEMTELRDIVRGAGPRSLVLGDEVCSGTESQSATALVGAVLQWLLDRRSCFLFATHLHDLLRLRVLESKGIQVAHLRVLTDAAGRLVYERTLRAGAGSSQYGLEVARAMDMPLGLMEAAFSNRRLLGGETAVESAEASSWNAGLLRRACEVCQHAIVRDLEVHHIQHRAAGGDNSLRNLIVVCQRCHDAHHAGQLEIGPLRMTSEGPVRSVAPSVSVSHADEGSVGGGPTEAHTKRVSKWSEEEIQCIQDTLEQFRAFPIKRVLFELNKKGISISSATLKKMRG